MQAEPILECPHCKNTGTAWDCKDFTLLTLGYFLCRKCGKTFTLYGLDWKVNVGIAYSQLDDSQQKAVDTMQQDWRGKK
jgi:hypothetical protein